MTATAAVIIFREEKQDCHAPHTGENLCIQGAAMDFFDVVHTRRSIRKYAEGREPVTDEHLEKLLRAAMAAPSAGNQQPWRFLVVHEQKRLDQIPALHSYAKMVHQVGTAIVVCADPQGAKWPQFWPQDCSAATENLLLAARALGLGAVWCGIYPERERMAAFQRLFNLPEHVQPFALVPIGQMAGEAKVADRYRPELIHWETW